MSRGNEADKYRGGQGRPVRAGDILAMNSDENESPVWREGQGIFQAVDKAGERP